MNAIKVDCSRLLTQLHTHSPPYHHPNVQPHAGVYLETSSTVQERHVPSPHYNRGHLDIFMIALPQCSQTDIGRKTRPDVGPVWGQAHSTAWALTAWDYNYSCAYKWLLRRLSFKTCMTPKGFLAHERYYNKGRPGL